MSHYSHNSFFIILNFKIWVYIENVWIKRHIVLFIATNFEIWVYKENMCLVIHIVTFLVANYQNMGIQGNENSFFT